MRTDPILGRRLQSAAVVIMIVSSVIVTPFPEYWRPFMVVFSLGMHLALAGQIMTGEIAYSINDEPTVTVSRVREPRRFWNVVATALLVWNLAVVVAWVFFATAERASQG